MAAEFEDLGRKAIDLSQQFKIAGHPTLAHLLIGDAHRFLAQAKAARQSGVPERLGDQDEGPPLLPYSVDVPELQSIPDSLLRIQERAKGLGFDFTPIFYPQMDLTQYSNFWKGMIMPEDRFWLGVNAGEISANSANLNGNWALIETVQKPGSDQERPDYYEGDDPLTESIISFKDRRRGGLLGLDDSLLYTRFGLSAKEVEGFILPSAAEMLGIEAGEIGLPRYIEYNVAGNYLCPEWGLTDTWEVLADGVTIRDVRLMGGNSQNGGLSMVDFIGASAPNEKIGFRLQIVPQAKAS